MRAIIWNVGKVERHVLEGALARCDADIVVLPECPETLRQIGNLTRITTPQSRLAILAKIKSARIIREDPARKHAAAVLRDSNVLVVGCHLPSMLHRRTEDALTSAVRLRDFIELSEAEIGHNRTVVLGDMNMDPYDAGMVHFEGLHAVMSRSVAAKERRTLQSVERRFFYNPMWSLYGDLHKQAAATYFYSPTKSMTYYWHMFDQVLLRPGLISNLNRIEILESIGGITVVDASCRSGIVGCDHLPVILELDLTKRQVDQPASKEGQ
jgi:exonuclease III